MKGRTFIIKLGIYILVRIKGVTMLTSKFLKNSTSSNKLRIKPKQ